MFCVGITPLDQFPCLENCPFCSGLIFGSLIFDGKLMQDQCLGISWRFQENVLPEDNRYNILELPSCNENTMSKGRRLAPSKTTLPLLSSKSGVRPGEPSSSSPLFQSHRAEHSSLFCVSVRLNRKFILNPPPCQSNLFSNMGFI